MRALRSYSLAAVLIPVFLVACSSNEPPPPTAKSEKARPSQPQAAATPATTDASKAEATPVPSATPRPAGSVAAPAQPDTPVPTAPVTAAPAPAPAAKQELAVAPPAQQPAAQAPAAPVPQAPAKPASAVPPAQVAPQSPIILKATLGGIRFEHRTHSEIRKVPCETCHHASRAEKPATAPQQACRLCHTAAATPPMKTKLQAAFHNPTATAGTCIDCHKTSNTKGLAAPVKCLDCHKKEYK